MIWELNGNINWPGVCHVNGPSWFSGGTALTQFGQCIHVFVLYNTCLGNAQNGIASLQYVFASCEICLCVLYKCLAPSLRLSLTLDNGPSVSGSALLIEFLHRGHYLNESCKKRPQLWSFAKTPPQSLIFFLAL